MKITGVFLTIQDQNVKILSSRHKQNLKGQHDSGFRLNIIQLFNKLWYIKWNLYQFVFKWRLFEIYINTEMKNILIILIVQKYQVRLLYHKKI